MESLHKMLKFRKFLKIFCLLVAMWIVSLLTIVREYKRDAFFAERSNMYEQAFSRFRDEFGSNGPSAFRAWDFLPRGNGSITEEEKLNVVKGYDDPPGDFGRPVYLEKTMSYEIKEMIRSGWKQHSFNEFVSSLIPVNRSLPDVRDNWCQKQNYSTVLPSATVIICFFNEAWSTLIRTVTSVLNRSPPHLLDHVILVDDNSSLPSLQTALDDYVASMSKVSLIRAPDRLGIIKARMLPVPQVQSPVIVYLDSHCECSDGWLEPLLQRIYEDSTRVVSPVIDNIHADTFEYIQQETNELQLGGFTWDLSFIWTSIPQDIYMRRRHQSDPIKTPTIAGGIYAINKEFFERIGFYDNGMEIWGGENLELSFKTWMCGGSLEIIPCSHVGHLFRKRIPYEERNRSLVKNFVRLAEVWLDDYAKYYYERIGNRKGDYGNVLDRVALRKKLKCKSFQWYLKNVYPQLELPDKYVASGQIYSADYNLCLDAVLGPSISNAALTLIRCHFQGQNQFWYYSPQGEIRRDEMCLDYKHNTLIMFFCNNDATQVWLYFEKQQFIMHMVTEQCWNIARRIEGAEVALTNCVGSRTQRWIIENFKPEKLTPLVRQAIDDIILRNNFYKHEQKVLNVTKLNNNLKGGL